MASSGPLANILRFLRTVSAQLDDDERPPQHTAIRLVFLQGTSRTVVRTWKVQLDADELEHHAQSMLDAAQADCDSVGTACRYQLETSDSAQGRCILTLQPEDGSAVVESFDAGGRVGDQILYRLLDQATRHNETLLRFVTGLSTDIHRMQNQTIQEQAKALREYEQGRIQMFTTMEEYASKKHERDLAVKITESQEARKDLVGAKLINLLPVVLNRIAGKPLMPGTSNPRDEMIRNLVKSIQGHQLEHIAKVFSPEQQILLFELYNEVLEAEKAEKEKAEKEGGGQASSPSPAT